MDILEHQSGTPRRLIFTQLYEVFFTYVKVAFFGAAFISFPVVSSQIWLFVTPACTRSEKRALLPFLLATPVLFLLGAALANFSYSRSPGASSSASRTPAWPAGAACRSS